MLMSIIVLVVFMLVSPSELLRWICAMLIVGLLLTAAFFALMVGKLWLTGFWILAVVYILPKLYYAACEKHDQKEVGNLRIRHPRH